jgi:hypothetical protein
MLAEKLGMTADKAEEWIVNLIREARLDAKIDSAAVSSDPRRTYHRPHFHLWLAGTRCHEP